jgi:hypothetical protein
MPGITGDATQQSQSLTPFSSTNPPVDKVIIDAINAQIANLNALLTTANTNITNLQTSKADTTALTSGLNNKVEKIPPILGGAFTLATCNEQGQIVTYGNANTSYIDPSSNRNYLTDAQLAKLSLSFVKTLTPISQILPGYSNVLLYTGLYVSPNVGGTLTTPAVTGTNNITKTFRSELTSSASSGGQFGCIYLNGSNSYSTLNVSVENFNFAGKVGTPITTVNNNAFFGLSERALVYPTTPELTPLTNSTHAKIGMAIDNNTGNWNIIHNTAGTVPSVLDLGSNFPVNNSTMYELQLYSNLAGGVDYTVINSDTKAVATGTISTNLPAPASFLERYCYITQGVASSVSVKIASAYMTLNA